MYIWLGAGIQGNKTHIIISSRASVIHWLITWPSLDPYLVWYVKHLKFMLTHRGHNKPWAELGGYKLMHGIDFRFIGPIQFTHVQVLIVKKIDIHPHHYYSTFYTVCVYVSNVSECKYNWFLHCAVPHIPLINWWFLGPSMVPISSSIRHEIRLQHLIRNSLADFDECKLTMWAVDWSFAR